MAKSIQHLKNRFIEFYQRHEVLVSISVFILGFLFDIQRIKQIDDLLYLIQQAVYLTLLGTLLLIEIRLRVGTFKLSPKGLKFWKYHNLIVHFIFGSLLRAYTIFYYSSASHFSSFLFISLIAVFMLANEIPKFQRLGLPIRIILYNICALSFFSFFYPILLGHVGNIPFWMAFTSSLLVMVLLWKFNFGSTEHKYILKRHVVIPSLAVHLLFVFSYYTSLIPPVPMAIRKIGIYTNVIKSEGKYIGERSKNSKELLVRTGDKVMVLLSIYSPAQFRDQIFLKWYLYDSKKGFTLQDTIPLTISGGRKEGFRGFGSKQFYQAGLWKILVETSDGREVGRIKIEIRPDHASGSRSYEKDVY